MMEFNTLEEINKFIEESGHPTFYIAQYGDVFALYEKDCTVCNYGGMRLHKLHILSKHVGIMMYIWGEMMDATDRYIKKKIKDIWVAAELAGDWEITGGGWIYDIQTFNDWCICIGIDDIVKMQGNLTFVNDMEIGGIRHILFDGDLYMVTDEYDIDHIGESIYSIKSKNYEVSDYGEAIKQALWKGVPDADMPAFFNSGAWFATAMLNNSYDVLAEDMKEKEKLIGELKSKLKSNEKELRRIRKKLEAVLDSMEE